MKIKTMSSVMDVIMIAAELKDMRYEPYQFYDKWTPEQVAAQLNPRSLLDCAVCARRIIEAAHKEMGGVGRHEEFHDFFMNCEDAIVEVMWNVFLEDGPRMFCETTVEEEFYEDGSSYAYYVNNMITGHPVAGKLPLEWYRLYYSNAGHYGLIGKDFDVRSITRKSVNAICDLQYSQYEIFLDSTEVSVEARQFINDGKTRLANKALDLSSLKFAIDYAISSGDYSHAENDGLYVEDYLHWSCIDDRLMAASIKAFGKISIVGIAIARFANRDINKMRAVLKPFKKQRKVINLLDDDHYNGSFPVSIWWDRRPKKKVFFLHTVFSLLMAYANVPDHIIWTEDGLIESIEAFKYTGVCSKDLPDRVAAARNLRPIMMEKLGGHVPPFQCLHTILSSSCIGLHKKIMETTGFAESAMPSVSAEHDGYSISKMNKNSPLQFKVGDFAACCQSLDGAGAMAVISILFSEYADNYYVTSPTGEPIGDVMIWKANECYVVDSMESRKLLPEDVFCKLLCKIADQFDMPLVINSEDNECMGWEYTEMNKSVVPGTPVCDIVKWGYRDTARTDVLSVISPIKGVK